MASKKTIGICCIIAPIALMVFTLFTFAILSFVVSGGTSNGIRVFATIMNVILGFLGLISVIGIPVGLVVGIIFLTSRPKTGDDAQNKS